MKRYLVRIGIIWIFMVAVVLGLPAGFEEKENLKNGEDMIHTYVHSKSGLNVMWIENNDKNASFTLGVRTPTTDSTGVNHIIEHTVFTGSKNYHIPNLFFAASSKYPHVFMNAMTSADLTMYPFSTPYADCFEKLLDIYLDSIFCPNMLVQESSFFEESFHYNPITDTCGGVVYNEMKGAAQDISRILYQSVRRTVYADTHYANDSGGDPNVLPTLTYEQFIETYKKYYYPGNMYVVLYGDLPLEKTLSTIGSYIENSSKKSAVDVNVYPTNTQKLKTFTYESSDDIAYIVKSFQLKETLTPTDLLDIRLWMMTYLMHEKSYFHSRLQQMGICNIDIMIDDHLKYPIFSLIIGDIPKNQVETYDQLIDQVLGEIANIDFKQEKIETDTLRKIQLSSLEEFSESTRGIEIGQSVLDAWTHDKPLTQYFIEKDYLKNLNHVANTTKDRLLKIASQATTIILPEVTKTLVAPLELTKIQPSEWRNIIEEMANWQNESEDTLIDISLSNLIMPLEVTHQIRQKDGITYLHIPVGEEVLYTDIYLPTSHVGQDKLQEMFLYCYLLTQVVKNYTPYLGEFGVEPIVIQQGANYMPYVHIGISNLAQEISSVELFEVMTELLEKQDEKWFCDQLKNLCTSLKFQFEEDILTTLTSLAKGGLTGSARYEYEMGYPFYQTCKTLLEATDNCWIEQIKNMKDMLIFSKETVVAFTGAKKVTQSAQKDWQDYLKNLPRPKVAEVNYIFENLGQTCYYPVKGDVDYLVSLSDKKDNMIKGADYVVASYLTTDYLQPHIRIERGAYGSALLMKGTYQLLYTYRDPNYQSSLEIIEKINETDSLLSEQKFYSAKAGALSSLQKQFAVNENGLIKSAMLQRLFLQGRKIQDVKKYQKEIVALSLKDFQKSLEEVTTALNTKSIAVGTQKTDGIRPMADKVYYFDLNVF